MNEIEELNEMRNDINFLSSTVSHLSKEIACLSNTIVELTKILSDNTKTKRDPYPVKIMVETEKSKAESLPEDREFRFLSDARNYALSLGFDCASSGNYVNKYETILGHIEPSGNNWKITFRYI